MDNREKAKELLVQYLRTAFEKSGLQWDWDNTAEINAAVDKIIDAAVELAVIEIKQQIEAGTQ